MNYILVRTEDILEHKLFKVTDKTNNDGTWKNHRYIQKIKTASGFNYIYPEDVEKQGRRNTGSSITERTNNFLSRFTTGIKPNNSKNYRLVGKKAEEEKPATDKKLQNILNRVDKKEERKNARVDKKAEKESKSISKAAEEARAAEDEKAQEKIDKAESRKSDIDEKTAERIEKLEERAERQKERADKRSERKQERASEKADEKKEKITANEMQMLKQIADEATAAKELIAKEMEELRKKKISNYNANKSTKAFVYEVSRSSGK